MSNSNSQQFTVRVELSGTRRSQAWADVSYDSMSECTAAEEPALNF